MILKLFNTPSEMFLECAKDFIADAKYVASHKKNYDVAMLGGTTAKDFFININKFDPQEIPMRIFFSDERFVPIDDENSNANTALKFLNVDKNNIFPIYQQNLDAVKCALAYENLLKTVLNNHQELPIFDSIYLGMGNDGHTASLFSGCELKDGLIESFSSSNINFTRITFCPRLIKAAKRIVIIAHGEEKRKVVADIIADNFASNSYPIKKIINDSFDKTTFFLA